MRAYHLALIAVLALAVALTLCYGAMRVAERVADASRQKLEEVQP